MENLKYRIGLVIALVALSLALVAPTFFREDLPSKWLSKPIRKGLDLSGGSYLVYEVLTHEAVKSQLSSIAISVRADLKKEKIGLKRAKQSGDRAVEFTLLRPEGVAKLDGYLRENYPDLHKVEEKPSGSETVVVYDVTPAKALEIEKESVVQAIETIRNRIDQYGVAEPIIQRSGEKNIVLQLPEITNTAQVEQTVGSVARLEFRLVSDPRSPNADTLSLKSRDGGRLTLEDEVVMTGDAVQTANVEINPQTNEVEVTMKLNALGKSTFARITEENVGRQLAIILDGTVQSAPVIRSAITQGIAQISGGFTRDEAHRLAVVLRSGALPAGLKLEERRTVGASLGADSIQKGVRASFFGSAVVVLFMILYYRRSGALAVACVVCNILMLLGLLALLKATLTLPGIAGIALTIGMAVDANIIIFERIRDELRLGVTPQAAIEAGFKRAHWTVLDANITTLLTGLILYTFGTGPIKGFAVTLSLGILTTLVTALFFAKVGYAVFNFRTARGTLSI